VIISKGTATGQPLARAARQRNASSEFVLLVGLRPAVIFSHDVAGVRETGGNNDLDLRCVASCLFLLFFWC